MPVTARLFRMFVPLNVRHQAAGMVAVLCGLAAPCALAQQPPGAAQDHRLIVARTVQPRIAYRGVPLADNPVQVQATVFPGRVFHDALGQSMDLVLGTDLDQRGSAGIDAGAATRNALAVGSPALGAGPRFGGGHAAAAAPMGPGASIGGAASGATRGLGSLITGSLMPALGAATAPPPPGGGP